MQKYHAELFNRRQRATEAAYDADDNSSHDGYSHSSIRVGIEVATQVKITDDIVKAAYDNGETSFRGRKRIIEAAFRAAGFEVMSS